MPEVESDLFPRGSGKTDITFNKKPTKRKASKLFTSIPGSLFGVRILKFTDYFL
jgi:hypothetical protein